MTIVIAWNNNTWLEIMHKSTAFLGDSVNMDTGHDNPVKICCILLIHFNRALMHHCA